MKRTGILLLAMLAGGVVGSLADDVWVDRLPYRNVTVVDVRGGKIIFEMGGRRLEKPLAEVTRVRLKGHAALNRAEDLLEEGRLEEAIAAYEQALAASTLRWQRALIQERLAAARRRQSQPAGPATAASRPSSGPAKRCYFCGSTGWMPCPGCRAGGRNTGLGRCGACEGKGHAVCPECKGESYKQVCPRCKGKGQVVVGTSRQGAFLRKIYGRCPDCEGTGYLDYCWRCKDRPKKLQGTIVCPACKGTGIGGNCPTCAGLKKIPCAHCQAGRKRAAEFKRMVLATSAPADVPAAGDAASVWVLSTPKTFLESRPKEPDYSKMTTLQWAMAEKEYQEKLRAFRRKYLGKEVKWPLKIQDIAPVGDEGEVALVGVSPGKIRVTVEFTQQHVPVLAKFSKGDRVVVSGIIVLYTAEEGKHSLVGPDGSLKLRGKGIVTGGSKSP